MDFLSALNVLARLPPAESDTVVSGLCTFVSLVCVIQWFRWDLSEIEKVFVVEGRLQVASAHRRIEWEEFHSIGFQPSW